MDFSSITFSFFLIFTGQRYSPICRAVRASRFHHYFISPWVRAVRMACPRGGARSGDIGHVGIIFLLFLLGLDIVAQALWATLRKSTVVAVFSSPFFWRWERRLHRYLNSTQDSLVLAQAMMFSSTVSVSNCCLQRYCITIGELMIGLLLLQDLLAIITCYCVEHGLRQ